MGLEVTNILRIKLSGLDYQCGHAFLGTKCLHGLLKRTTTTALIIIHGPVGFAAGKNRRGAPLAAYKDVDDRNDRSSAAFASLEREGMEREREGGDRKKQ